MPDAAERGSGKARSEDNRARYNAFASRYGALARFGGLARFYRAVAEDLTPCPGGTIVDVGCGPATLTPYLLDRVGASGRVVGVDVSDEMVRRAREIADRSGWRNAVFERSDAIGFSPDSVRADAVVFCLSLSTMPDCRGCLERALTWLAPNGQLVILDSIPEPDRRLARLVMHLKAPLVGARPTAVPLEFAARQLEGVHVRHLSGGVYTLVSGRKPGTPR